MWSFVMLNLSCHVSCCCGVDLVVCCVVMFLSCVCVCDLFFFLQIGEAGQGLTRCVSILSSVVKCLWEVFVWGFGMLFVSCVVLCCSCCVFRVKL